MVKEDLLKKYNIDLEALKKEQLKLAKTLSIKDIGVEFDRIGAIENVLVKNKIISAMIVCDRNFEIIEQEYFIDKLRFPYIFGFKAYRELPIMTAVFSKIREKPDIVLVHGEGINHERLGIASHFSLLTGVPTIGVSDRLYEGNRVIGSDVMMAGKKVGRMFRSKEGSRPLYICPGDKISIASASEMIKSFIIPPHKLPEPMNLAHKYVKQVRKEIVVD